MTDEDRERIAGVGDHGPRDRYEAASNVRSRLSNLVIDLRLLEDHHPDPHEDVVTRGRGRTDRQARVAEAEQTARAAVRGRARLYDEIADSAAEGRSAGDTADRPGGADGGPPGDADE